MKDTLHTPWSDEITLVWLETTKDSANFETITPHRSCPPLLCDFENGVSQSEFYRSMKAGVQATAQAEVQKADFEDFWPKDYTDLRYAEFRGKRYRILRSFPQSFDTLTLILSEVIR